MGVEMGGGWWSMSTPELFSALEFYQRKIESEKLDNIKF